MKNDKRLSKSMIATMLVGMMVKLDMRRKGKRMGMWW